MKDVLPIDVIKYIFSFLDDKSVCSVSNTARFFKETSEEETQRRILNLFAKLFSELEKKVNDVTTLNQEMITAVQNPLIYKGNFQYFYLSDSNFLAELQHTARYLRVDILKARLFFEGHKSKLKDADKDQLEAKLKELMKKFAAFCPQNSFTDQELNLDAKYLSNQPLVPVQLFLSSNADSVALKIDHDNVNPLPGEENLIHVSRDAREIIASHHNFAINNNIHPILKKANCHSKSEVLVLLQEIKASPDCCHFLTLAYDDYVEMKNFIRSNAAINEYAELNHMKNLDTMIDFVKYKIEQEPEHRHQCRMI